MVPEFSLCGLSPDELVELVKLEGFTQKHAVIVTNFFYKRKGHKFNEIRNLSVSIKKCLENNFVTGFYPPISQVNSDDNTVKYLFRNQEGLEFETVAIPDGKRYTVCVSTQSGCKMGCTICATARYGFKGNLSAGDIINQILSLPEASSVTHVVFMGMGEPMDNIENVLKACTILTSEWGVSLSPRNITVSTVGILPSVKIFLEKSACNLTFSLFSPFPEQRRQITGLELLYPASEVIKYMSLFPIRRKRRLSIAYVMIKGFNDSENHLQELKKVLGGLNIRINLLPYHSTNDGIYTSSTPERLHQFKHELVLSGISESVRKARGADIDAACGLLASGLTKYSY